MKNPAYELTSIRFSHYVEKVRWAMDYYGIAYQERPLLPIIHFFVVPWVVGWQGRNDTHSSRFSTPVLKTPDGKIFCKSDVILKYLSQHHGQNGNNLHFHPEAEKWEHRWSETLGPHARRLAYFHLLTDKELILHTAEKNVPAIQCKLFRYFYPVAKAMLQQGLMINPSNAEKSRKILSEEWKLATEHLKDGRPFWLGDQFSVADLSFASLAGALLFISPTEGYGAYLPKIQHLPPALKIWVEELRQTSVGQWVLRLYREQRGQRLIPCYPLLNS